MINDELEIIDETEETPVDDIDAEETLINQLVDDLKEVFSEYEEYSDIVIKPYYEDFPNISYPMVVIEEIENNDVNKFYDGKEHVIDVGYQLTIQAEQSETLTAIENVQNIINIIKNYMRGERYHALRRIGNTPVTTKRDDENIRIGYMRYVGRIDIDTNTIYRRN